MASLESAALAIAQRGFAVFPCKARAKIPLTRHGCLDATTDSAQVRAWWRQYPNANIAVATGKPSGIFVIDVDGEGEIGIREIEKKHGTTLPATVEAITPGGGRHLYYKLPRDGAPTIKNSAKQIGTGLDVRGEGGYVIAPPSIHPSGGRYSWSVDSAREFAEPPAWLIAHICLRDLRDNSVAKPHRSAEHWAQIGKGVPAGCRNHSAASLIGHLLSHGISAQLTRDLALGWNRFHNPDPIEDDEVIAVVRNIARRELRKRNGRPHEDRFNS